MNLTPADGPLLAFPSPDSFRQAPGTKNRPAAVHSAAGRLEWI